MFNCSLTGGARPWRGRGQAGRERQSDSPPPAFVLMAHSSADSREDRVRPAQTPYAPATSERDLLPIQKPPRNPGPGMAAALGGAGSPLPAAADIACGSEHGRMLRQEPPQPL